MPEQMHYVGVEPEQLLRILKMELAPLYKKLELIQKDLDELKKKQTRGDK